jgi:hypothetical protein
MIEAKVKTRAEALAREKERELEEQLSEIIF